MKCCYLIYCKDLDIKEIYVGHSKNLHKRKISHLNRCMNSNDIGYNFKVYKFIRENGGFDNFEFTILEEDCEKIREKYWYEHFDYLPQLNSDYPGRTLEEYLQSDERKEQKKKYNKAISTCGICGKIYQHKNSLRRHIRENHE